jgi:Fuc2NAc and GlcNAc transferase
MTLQIALMLCGVVLMAFLLTALLRRHSGALSLVDFPTDRGAHSRPTPRGGGVAIVLISLPFYIWLLSAGHIEPVTFAVLFAAFPVALAGLVDDVRSLHPRWRLLLQLLVSLVVVYLLGPLPAISFGKWAFDAGAAVWFLVPMALIWLCNLYNFMDGIDSIAAVQCIFLATAVAFLVTGSAPGLALVAMGLSAAVAGFLVWNLPPARIFLGDSGSTFIGMLIGLMALLTLHASVMTLWGWVLLMGVFIADTGWTLLVRLFRGENCFHAHNMHAYQHAARRYGSHGKVVLGVLLINVVWLLPLTLLAESYPEYGVYLAISGIVPLVWLAHLLGAGSPGQGHGQGTR